MRRRSVAHAVIAVVLFTFTGCGGDGPDLAPVSGTVTMDGKPMDNVSVTFEPAGGGGSRGITGPDGRYQLSHLLQDSPGAAVGKHRVTIVTHQAQPVADDAKYSEKIPAKYNTESTLSFDVPESGTDAANFELNSK